MEGTGPLRDGLQSSAGVRPERRRDQEREKRRQAFEHRKGKAL